MRARAGPWGGLPMTTQGNYLRKAIKYYEANEPRSYQAEFSFGFNGCFEVWVSPASRSSNVPFYKTSRAHSESTSLTLSQSAESSRSLIKAMAFCWRPLRSPWGKISGKTLALGANSFSRPMTCVHSQCPNPSRSRVTNTSISTTVIDSNYKLYVCHRRTAAGKGSVKQSILNILPITHSGEASQLFLCHSWKWNFLPFWCVSSNFLLTILPPFLTHF